MKSSWMTVLLLMAGVLWCGAAGAGVSGSCPAVPPADPGLYKVLQQARRALDAGRSRAALALLSAYGTAHPRKRHYHLSFLMGTARYRLKQPARAEADFRAAAALMPCRDEVWQNIAAVRCDQGNYAGAAAALSVAFRLAPPDRDGWRRLGDLYRLAGVPLAADRAYGRAFGSDPAAGDLDLLVETCLEAHDLSRALDLAHLAARKAPTAPRWARAGDIGFRLGRYAQSLAAYQKAAAFGDPGGRMNLMAGVAAMKLARFMDAGTCFARALTNAAPQSDTARSVAQWMEVLQASKKNASFSERGVN